MSTQMGYTGAYNEVFTVNGERQFAPDSEATTIEEMAAAFASQMKPAPVDDSIDIDLRGSDGFGKP